MYNNANNDTKSSVLSLLYYDELKDSLNKITNLQKNYIKEQI